MDRSCAQMLKGDLFPCCCRKLNIMQVCTEAYCLPVSPHIFLKECRTGLALFQENVFLAFTSTETVTTWVPVAITLNSMVSTDILCTLKIDIY